MRKGITVVASLLFAALLVTSCGQKMTEEQLYAQALSYQEEQQWEELAKTYEKLVKAYPESPKADEHLYSLGMVYANNLKEFDKAIETWRRLLEEYPDSWRVTNTKFMIGYCYANDIKDMEKARQEYESFLAEYPDHELSPSVKWELGHLGQDISDIDLQLGDTEGNANAAAN